GLPVPPAPGGADDELAQAFRDEARETLHNLNGFRVRLEHQASDREAAAQCARLLHLLKGAAAVVGFDAIAGRAGELHAWFETARTAGLTAGGITGLGQGIDALVGRTLGERGGPAGAPAEPARAPGAGSGDDEPRRIFLGEAQAALDELSALVRQVQ